MGDPGLVLLTLKSTYTFEGVTSSIEIVVLELFRELFTASDPYSLFSDYIW